MRSFVGRRGAPIDGSNPYIQNTRSYTPTARVRGRALQSSKLHELQPLPHSRDSGNHNGKFMMSRLKTPLTVLMNEMRGKIEQGSIPGAETFKARAREGRKMGAFWTQWCCP